MPDQKEKIDSAQENLKKLRLQKQLDDIKRGAAAGRHEWVRKRLGEFPREDTDEKLLDQVRLLAEKYDTAVQNHRLARRFLSELPAKISDPTQRRLFTETAAVISAELTYDHFLKKENDNEAGRLDAFLSLAQQAEQQKEGSPGQNNRPSSWPWRFRAGSWATARRTRRRRGPGGSGAPASSCSSTSRRTMSRRGRRYSRSMSRGKATPSGPTRWPSSLATCRRPSRRRPWPHEWSWSPTCSRATATSRPLTMCNCRPSTNRTGLTRCCSCCTRAGRRPPTCSTAGATWRRSHGYLLVAPEWGRRPGRQLPLLHPGARGGARRAPRPAPPLPDGLRPGVPVRLQGGGRHGLRRRHVPPRSVRRHPARLRPAGAVHGPLLAKCAIRADLRGDRQLGRRQVRYPQPQGVRELGARAVTRCSA